MSNTDNLLNQILIKIEDLNNKIDTEFKTTNEKITNLEKSIVGMDAKIEGIDKRLSNEEMISRTALGGIFVGVALATIKYLFFPNP